MIRSLKFNQFSLFLTYFYLFLTTSQKRVLMRTVRPSATDNGSLNVNGWSSTRAEQLSGPDVTKGSNKVWIHISSILFAVFSIISPSIALCYFLHHWEQFYRDGCLLQSINVPSNHICLFLSFYGNLKMCMRKFDQGWYRNPATTSAVYHRPSECRSLFLCY